MRQPQGRFANTPTNILKTKDGYTLMISAPGMTKSDIEITVDQRLLTIKGNTQDSDLTYTHREFNPSRIYRTFELDKSIDDQSISAEMKDGILTIQLALVPEVKPRTIAIV